mgnify:CR=1 FL=1
MIKDNHHDMSAGCLNEECMHINDRFILWKRYIDNINPAAPEAKELLSLRDAMYSRILELDDIRDFHDHADFI